MLSPVHPRRLWARLIYVLDLLGRHRLRLWLGGLSPRRLALSARWLRGEAREIRRRRREGRLTVAVDVSPLWEPLTGIGWYLYRLLVAMADRDDVRLRLYGPDLVDRGDVPQPLVELPTGPALEAVTRRVPEDFSIVHDWLSLRLRRREGRLIALDRNDVLFAPNYLLPPRFDGCRRGALVATVHDLSVERVPETMRDSTHRELRRDLRSTMARARRLLTDSEAVRREITELGLAPEERIDVAALAPALELGSAPAPPAADWPRRYVLFVGTLEPRKNLGVLLSAFERWRESAGVEVGEEVSLLLCGGVGWKSEALLERLEKASSEGWLHRAGYLPAEQLAAAYAGAEWLALPSLYEGFGLPAVEAMAAGVPLLLADIPVLREVAGEAALYAPPEDVTAWAELLDRALSGGGELRARQASLAARRAARFSWRLTADATVASWRRAGGSGGSGGGMEP